MELNETHIFNNGWRLQMPEVTALSAYEQSFFVIEFLGQRSLEYYKSRARNVGIAGRKKVLDLACGMGQWSIAFAELNQHVCGVDLNSGRIAVAKKLAHAHELKNVDFSIGSMEKIPFEDETFDAVFCYGAFMFSNMPVALAEIKRVCRPGAIIYINANSVGWYLHLLFDRGIFAGNWGMFRTSMRMIWRGLRALISDDVPMMQMMVLPRHIHRLARSLDLEVLDQGAEGMIGANISGVEPAYPARFYGFTGIFEFAIRRGSSSK